MPYIYNSLKLFGKYFFWYNLQKKKYRCILCFDVAGVFFDFTRSCFINFHHWFGCTHNVIDQETVSALTQILSWRWYMGGSEAIRMQEGVKSAQNKRHHGQMGEMDIWSLVRELSYGSGAKCGSHGTDPGIRWGGQFFTEPCNMTPVYLW